MKLSVVMLTVPDRKHYFDYSLPTIKRQGIPKDDLECVIAEKEAGANLDTIKDKLLEVFGTVRWLVTKKPDFGGATPVATNLAFKRATHDAVFYMQPECIQMGTLRNALKLYKENRAVFFRTFKSEASIWDDVQNVDFETTPYSKIVNSLRGIISPAFVGLSNPRCWWWLSCLIPRLRFLEYGGMEETCQVACSDDIAGTVFLNNGMEILIDQGSAAVHLWHEPAESAWKSLEPYQRDYNMAEAFRVERRLKANEGRSWGDERFVVHEEVWAA